MAKHQITLGDEFLHQLFCGDGDVVAFVNTFLIRSAVKSDPPALV
jgi:hypothetical protein